MSDCPRAGKLFGCKFSSRYSVNEGWRPTDSMMFFSGQSLKPIPRKSVYVRDVCERCGKTVEREGAK